MIHVLALRLLLCINRLYRRLLEGEIISVGYVQMSVTGAFRAFEYHHSCKPN